MADKVYSWKDGAVIKADAQQVGERLEWLETRHNGLLTPDAILADAKKKRSPLHEAFEWDDTEAAHQYRLEQARSMMRSIKIEIRHVRSAPSKPVRAYVNVRRDDDKGYAPVAKVMENEELRQQVLQRAWRELQNWRERYREYEELIEVFSAIEKTADRIAG